MAVLTSFSGILTWGKRGGVMGKRPRSLWVFAVGAMLLPSVIHCGRQDRGTGSPAERAPRSESNTAEVVRRGQGDVREPADWAEIDLAYDNGTAEMNHSPWSQESGGQVAVGFTPASYPARLRSARFYVTYAGLATAEFRVRVYQGSLNEGPKGPDLLSSPVTASATEGGTWVEVDLGGHAVTIDSAEVFIAMEWLSAPGPHGVYAQFLGADTDQPDGRSWWKHTPRDSWVKVEEIGDAGDRDLMIRASVAEDGKD
jgi:hypothetical protein